MAKAEEFVFNLYFEHEAWDALVDHFVFETTATVWSTWPWSLRLKDTLVERSDVRRLKRCWGRMIADEKNAFWEYRSFCIQGRLAVARGLDAGYYDAESEASLLRKKQRLLETLEEARRMMLDLGEAGYALKLKDDCKSIEQETRGKKLPKPVDRAMDVACFWELIETAKQDSESDAEQMDLLLETLEKFKASEIGKFRLILDVEMDELFHWDVWALAFLAMGGCGDDGFEYFREWLILQGRDLVATVKRDVQRLDGLPSGSRLQVEGLLSIPEVAYENRSGKPLRPRKRKTTKVKGQEWDESDLQNRYPILYARYT
ncbi:MAG: DUF4240 domain-containing protein [Bryobacteraceae bacterium]